MTDLRKWCEQILDEAPELTDGMRSLWVSQGKMRCGNCGRPVYCDNGPGNSSGYYFHAGHGAVDGKNGLYCSPASWEGGAKQGAYPTKPQDIEDVARAVLELL